MKERSNKQTRANKFRKEQARRERRVTEKAVIYNAMIGRIDTDELAASGNTRVK